MVKTRVKVCCISSVNEAQLAMEMGASALGLVGPMPSGPGVIDHELSAQIVRKVPPPVATFLLTSEITLQGILDDYNKVHSSVIQLVDAVQAEVYAQLRERLPHVKLVQVIHVLDASSVDEAREVAQHVDALLLDSGNPKLAVKELGGTGRTHDWSLSKKICEEVDVPVFLAGGLNPSNIRTAVEKVKPYGVDLCSGVRTNGALDVEKLKHFFQELST